MNDTLSVQERYAPHNKCFGCGPANSKGLRIRSFEKGEELRAEWTPESHHEAFDGMVNGGIIGALLDCHSNWAAALHLMKASGLETPPCTVTSEFHVKLRRVTPSDGPLEGYNETTTHAFMRLIDATRRAYGRLYPTPDADTFCDTHPQLMSKHILRLFYSPQRRGHPAAKQRFIEPDLAPLPEVPVNDE